MINTRGIPNNVKHNMNKNTKTYTQSPASPIAQTDGNASPRLNISSDSDLEIGPLLSPLSPPPSPGIFRLNLSNYLPLTNENDDSLVDNLSQEGQNIEVVTGISFQDSEGWESEESLPDGWITRQDPLLLQDPDIPDGWNLRNNNITVRRDNRGLLASQLPVLFVTNHRSFFPKFNNFLDLMNTYNLTLGLHLEIWEVKEKREHQNKIEEALEMEGIKYISNPRPTRRGGGAAITLIEGEFTLTKLDIVIPKSLEVVWGLVRPRTPTIQFKGIIVCSFYLVPHSTRKSQLVEHIALNYSELKVKHKDFFFLMGGDKNDLDTKKLLDISPALHMLNTKPTHGNKNIDVLITDMAHLYHESVILPSVPTDIPPSHQGGGQPSDHSVVTARPMENRLNAPAKETILKKTRRVDQVKLAKV